jgi:hypothetical protein
MREIIRSFTVLMLVAAASGCGGDSYGPTGRVTGKLTVDGKPLAAGHAVSFMQMEKGFLAFGLTDADGNFEVKSWNQGNMPVGKYDVMIAPPGGGESEADSSRSAEERFEAGQVSGGKPRVQFPVRYRETTTSGLHYAVVEGENHFDIDLKPK